MGLEKSGKPRLSRKPIYETHPDSLYFLNTVHSRTDVISRPFGVLNSNPMDLKFLLFLKNTLTLNRFYYLKQSNIYCISFMDTVKLKTCKGAYDI